MQQTNAGRPGAVGGSAPCRAAVYVARVAWKDGGLVAFRVAVEAAVAVQLGSGGGGGGGGGMDGMGWDGMGWMESQRVRGSVVAGWGLVLLVY